MLLADIADAVDLDWSFVPEGRAQMAATGACEIPGFVRADALPAFVDDARRLAPLAHRSGGLGTVYLGFPDESFPLDHPQQWLGHYALGAVAYDLFPADSPIRRLYEWPELTRFVAAILGLDEIYPYADPLGALNLAVMTDGDQLQWHFDQTDFVVSLAIQDADDGGDFEVAPQIRTADDEHYDDVARVLAGERERVVTLPMTPGTLLVFAGRYSIHRVSPIVGHDAAPRRAARLRHQAGHDVERPAEGSPLRAHGVTDRSMQVGEGFAGDGPNAAHVNTVLGAKDGPVGTAWATALATPRLGHAPFVVVVRPNVPVKPFTLFVNKSAIDGEKNERHARLTWGAAQAGVAAGVIAAVRKGIVSEADADELLLIAAVWVESRRPTTRTPCTRTTKPRRSPRSPPVATARRPSPTCSPRARRRTRSSAHEHHARAGRARDCATRSSSLPSGS